MDERAMEVLEIWWWFKNTTIFSSGLGGGYGSGVWGVMMLVGVGMDDKVWFVLGSLPFKGMVVGKAWWSRQSRLKSSCIMGGDGEVRSMRGVGLLGLVLVVMG